jgi:hypothetical protein
MSFNFIFRDFVIIRLSENCFSSAFRLANAEINDFFSDVVNIIRVDDGVKVDRAEMEWNGVEWSHLAQDKKNNETR